MIDWPESFIPLPKRNLAVDHDPRLLSQRMEIGIRQRNRFSDSLENLNVTWELNFVQWSYFKTFVETVLKNGAEKFSITLPTVEGLKRVEALIVEGKYKESFYTGGVDISADLEIIDPVILREDVFYLMGISAGISSGQTGYDTDFITMQTKLHDYINSIQTI